MLDKSMKIVVLAGGTSSERDVSIVSGTGVCKALRARGHRAILLDVFFGDAAADLQDAFPVEYDVDAASARMSAQSPGVAEAVRMRRCFFGPLVLDLCSQADMVFLALHGANGEDGRLQAAFDLFGIPYTGTGYLSSAIAMDKTMTKQFFRANNVPTPEGFSLVKGTFEQPPLPQEKGLAYPVIVKPCCGGSSVGASIANNDHEYLAALDASFALEPEAVIEEYITGREFSVAVIGGKAFPVIEIAPKEGFYDYKNKYSAGAAVETCPADLPDEITKEMQDLAVRGAEALAITGYCRLDFIMGNDGRIVTLEANTLPGMTPTSLIPQEAAVLGIPYPELCELLIELSM